MKRGPKPIELPVTRLLTELRNNGGSLVKACREAGVVERTVLRRLRTDADLAAQVNAARKEGREAAFVHGSPGGHNRCHCDICRFSATNRMQKYRNAATGEPCPECGRVIGSRYGKRYAHHSDPGVVCPGSEFASGAIRELTEAAS